MGAASDLFKAAGANTVHTIMPFSSIHNMRAFRQSAIATDGVCNGFGQTHAIKIYLFLMEVSSL